MDTGIKAHRLAVAAALSIALAGCGSTNPVAYSGIASASLLHPNPQDSGGRVPYSYSTAVDWQKYSAIVIDPVEVYRGPDQQFGDMSEADKTTLANYMQSQFTAKLQPRFRLTNTSALNTLRIKLTLTGASTSTPVLATLSRFDLAGGLYNGVQAVRGREGALTGSVLYAVEIYDAPSNRLLSAFIEKQYPNPYNLGASIGSLAAAKTGIEKGAEALATQLK